MNEADGGRIFSPARAQPSKVERDLQPFGRRDIGSSTSHLGYRACAGAARQPLCRHRARDFYESDILLTPYRRTKRSMPSARRVHRKAICHAKVQPDEIDTGALSHGRCGPAEQCARHRRAVRQPDRKARRGQRGRQSGTVMAAYGSGAVSRAVRDNTAVMNVDIGGGTSKIAGCAEGKVIDLTAAMSAHVSS